jgi:hypothetical protein
MLANSMQDLHELEDDRSDVEDGDQSDVNARPPRHTAVLDGNAYDRKMGLCADKAHRGSKGKRLGWCPDQVQVIEDDCVVVVETEGGDHGPAGDAAAAEPRLQPPAPSLPKSLPKGILKGSKSERPAPSSPARAPLAPPATSPPQAGSAALTKPCFEFAQTGKCRRGGANGGLCGIFAFVSRSHRTRDLAMRRDPGG